MCSRVQATTNSFFLFLDSPPGFLFTVTVQQGSHSLSLSLSVPLSSSLTVRALADMPRQKHTADHTDITLSFDP